MKVFPQYSGPMSEWPEAAAEDGAETVLEDLNQTHPMFVATNATDSDAEQVWKALERVKISQYFRAVFTSKALGGSRKPETSFFEQIARTISRPPHEFIMVGDAFTVDITGAKAAGWKAVWYNPNGSTAPGLLPLHDVEIVHLRQLPAALQKRALPDYNTSLAWLIERGTPFNILAHVQLVAAAAYQLAVWLRAAGEHIDPVLTHRGGLLHDLAKMDSIRLKNEHGAAVDHAAMARDLLLERAQPKLAEIADRHMLFQDADDPHQPRTWEQKLVHYADKLAEGARLVGLEERIQFLQTRYPHVAEAIKASQPNIVQMQGEICERLRLSPDELIARLRKATGI
jgi:putative hydrolase of the HAD superfamily